MSYKLLVASALAAAACYAQPYEVGASAGYGAYHNGSVSSSAGTVAAGIRNRYVVGAVAGEDLYAHFSGEIRYLYQPGDPFVSRGTLQGSAPGESHAIYYSMLAHLPNREARIRPYVAAGFGARNYRVTGSSPASQQLPSVATIETQNQWTWLFVPGIGIKLRVAKHVLARGEFSDYITPVPNLVIAPAEGGSAHGLLHQFTPALGLSYTF